MVLEYQKKNLVIADLVERRDQDIMSFGDKIHIPMTSEGSVVGYTEGDQALDQLEAMTDSERTIDIDQAWTRAFLIPWTLKAQSKFDIKAERLRSAAYGIAKKIDETVSAHSSSWSNTAITASSTVSAANCVDCFTALNVADVPAERVWVFHPYVLGDLLKLTGNYFTSMDFSESKGMVTGKIGMLLGSPVYLSTNVPTTSTGSPATVTYHNLYFNKQALALAMQVKPEIKEDEDVNARGNLVDVRTLFGANYLRADFGIRLNR
jgi:HK97 family phage major capsid protein